MLRLAAAGKTDRQIGQELAIAERTVCRHLHEIECKLGVNSRVEATAHAVMLGLVEQ